MKISIPRVALNASGRDFAVGDIHGCFKDLQKALDSVGFEPATDRLFSVGDLVDRGPESEEVLAWLEKPWFHAICGNHDFMAWRTAIGDPYPDVDHLKYGGTWLLLQPKGVQEHIGAALQTLPLAMEVQTPDGLVGLVHADCPYDDWANMHEDQTPQALECCLWSDERIRQQYEGKIKGIRAVVHGHTTLPAPKTLGNVFYIDTAGWPKGGFFTLLDLHSLQPLQGPIGTGLRFSPRYYR